MLKMLEEKEQHVCIKFCVGLGKRGAENFEMLKTAFGDDCLSCARTFEWLKKAELKSMMMMIHTPRDHQQAEMMIL
jgi:hypothetical protein